MQRPDRISIQRDNLPTESIPNIDWDAAILASFQRSNPTLQLKAGTANLDASQATTINLPDATEMIATIRQRQPNYALKWLRNMPRKIKLTTSTLEILSASEFLALIELLQIIDPFVAG